MKMIGAAMAILAAASGVHAQTRFEPYHGSAPVELGSGGSKITAYGVDFWTSGAPERRFRILGVLHDFRPTGLLTEKLVGNAAVARHVRALGGDAVVIGASRMIDTGRVNNAPTPASGSYNNSGVLPVMRNETLVVVVKYLG